MIKTFRVGEKYLIPGILQKLATKIPRKKVGFSEEAHLWRASSENNITNYHP